MMKRIFALILSAFIIISITACKKTEVTDEPEIGTQAEKNDEIKTISIITGEGYKREYDDDTYNTVIEVSYPVVMPYYGDEDNFPKLALGLEIGNTETKEELVGFIEENREYAYDHYEASGEGYYPFQSSVKPFVRRADTLVTSILYTGFTYTGGVRGETYYYGETYDSTSGAELVLSDVVDDMDALSGAIEGQLYNFYSETFGDSELNIQEVINDGSAYSWTLDYSGITFYFMPYSIDSYVESMVTVTVANEAYPNVLKKEYQQSPKAYGVELEPDLPLFYDVTGDGYIDKVYATGRESMDGDSGYINITVNGVTYSEENWFFDYDATLVHTADGKNYIYYELLRENDYREIVCYDLESEVKKIGSVDGGLRMIYHEGGEVLITQDALTNPESFYLQQTTQHLSTVTGYKAYHAGDNGVPVSDDKMFTFDEEKMITFTLLQGIELDVYHIEQNKVTGKKTLQPGEQVFYYATDNEKYALLKCSDGTLCRVECVFDDTDYYSKVNGIKLEELFDGIIFAG